MSNLFISDSQKDFIVSSIKNDFRTDGRSNNRPQKVSIKLNNLDHLLGSCLLNIQSSQNQIHIYTGIKIRVEKQETRTKQKTSQIKIKNITERVFLQLGCIKRLNEQEQQSRLYIEQYLNKYIVENHFKQFESLLTIAQAKRHYLTLHIEAYILSAPHIAYLEYLFVCIKSAIQNVKMPDFAITFNEITDQEIVEVKLKQINESSRGQKVGTISSPYQGLDGLKIVGVVGQNYVLGMTAEQYESVQSCLLVAFDIEKKVVRLQSLKGTLKVQQIHQIIKFAKI